MSKYINNQILKARLKRLIRAKCLEQDFISAQIWQRHLESLATISLPKGKCLDLACGFAPKLPQDLFGANSIRLDMINHKKAQLDLQATAENLPLENGSCAIVWANNLLPWIEEILKLMQEVNRVLVAGGLFTFTSLGPATLKQLQDLDLGSKINTLGFVDMHDLADMTMSAGFAEPVASCEVINLEYQNHQAMFNDLRKFGVLAVNGMHTSLGKPKKMLQTIKLQKPITLSFEIIYIHAWALPQRTPKLQSEWQEISFSQRASKAS